MGQKRRRIALSCVDCRRRKVKCDRTYPSCVRCQKGGYGDKCLYVSHTGDHNSSLDNENAQQTRENSNDSWVDEADRYAEVSRNNEAPTTTHPISPLPYNSATQPDPSLNPHSNPHVARSMTDSNDFKLKNLQGRLMELETHVYAAGGKPFSAELNMGLGNPSGPGYNRGRNYYADTYHLAENEKVLLRGHSFRTQYFGPSHSLAILLQFQDLSNFVREILLMLPSLSGVKTAMIKIREAEKKALSAQYDISIETLANLVPDRQESDRLVHEYLDSVETTYRILHIPTFLRDYDAFWAAPKDAKPEFVVQLLLAMSMVYCVVPIGESGFVGRSSARRETASHWVNVCAFWQQSQSNKHVSLANYQILIQLWLARRFNCIKIKREWTEIGALVRRFMAAGLHREPSLLCNKINTFDCEMRRRLWYTVLELDLQTTIDRGITPTLGPLDWDTEPPSNIEDEEFDLDSDKLPESKPRKHFTRTAFLAWAAESLPLRIELLYKINSIRTNLELDTATVYDDKLRVVLDEIPLDTWKEASVAQAVMSPMTPASAVPLQNATSTLSMCLAQLMIYEFLTILHQPYATDASLKSRHFLSRYARRYACLATLVIYNPQMGAKASRGINPQLQASDIHRRWLSFLREDNIRAALSLAHDFDVSISSNINPLRLHLQDDSRVISLINAEVALLDDRVRHLGQGFHCYWITSSALSFAHSKQNPDVPRSTFARAAADRVIKLHSHVIESQLPRARRMMMPGGEFGVPTRSNTNSPVATNENASGRKWTNENVESITSVEGAMTLQHPSLGDSALNTQPTVGLNGTMDAMGGIMGYDGMNDVSFLQDTMYGIEHMDWNMLMSADPTAFMMGGFDYPS